MGTAAVRHGLDFLDDRVDVVGRHLAMEAVPAS